VADKLLHRHVADVNELLDEDSHLLVALGNDTHKFFDDAVVVYDATYVPDMRDDSGEAHAKLFRRLTVLEPQGFKLLTECLLLHLLHAIYADPHDRDGVPRSLRHVMPCQRP
jgi:hypothetical protein